MEVLTTIVLILAVSALGVVTLNVLGWRRVGQGRASGRVSVLIPARNEEANLPACLESVLAQQAVAEVLVADDGSTDGTAAIVREFAARDTRLRLIQPPPLPPGWCGKNYACQQLADQAAGEWLLFLDADARLAPLAVERMLAQCGQSQVSFLSCWPQLRMQGSFEKLLMPMLNFVLLTLFPAPLAARRSDVGLGLAHGACIMMRAAEYRAIGGHASVRAELFEDTRLAQRWRAEGYRSLCLDGTGVVHVRMYDSLAGIWAGFRKNLYPAFGSAPAFWLFMLLHAGVFLLPFLALWNPWLAAAAGAVLLSRLLLALRFRHSLWSVLLHPLGELFLLAIGTASWLRVVSGRGVSWKGRTYRAAQENA